MDLNILFSQLCSKCEEIYSAKSEWGDFFNIPKCLDSLADFLKNTDCGSVTRLEVSSDELTMPNCNIRKAYFEDSGTMYLVLTAVQTKKYDVQRYIEYPDEISMFTALDIRTEFLLMEDIVLCRVNKKSVPATVRMMTALPAEIQEIVFSAYSGSLLWRDCIRDNLYIPAPLKKLELWHNKKNTAKNFSGFLCRLPSTE